MLTKESRIKMFNECIFCEGKGKIILKGQEGECFDCESKGKFEFNISIEQLIEFVKWSAYKERTMKKIYDK